MPNIRRIALVAAAIVALSAPALAQTVTDGQKEQALRLIDAIHVTDPFVDAPIEDAIVIEQRIVTAYPNLADQINQIVQDESLELASRFQVFKSEAALIYAKAFTEEELKRLADFFATDLGQKMLNEQEIMFREVGQAAEIWRNGFRTDLAQAVQQRVNDLLESDGTQAAQAPAEGESQDSSSN